MRAPPNAERAAPTDSGNGSLKTDRRGGSISSPSNEADAEKQECCKNCGADLPARRKLKTFCNYACRGQFRALQATRQRTGLSGSKNLKGLKALRGLKRRSIAGYAFAQINSITYQIDTRNKLGAGWLLEVGWPGGCTEWIARVGNRASKPCSLDAAKQSAITMLQERSKGEPRNVIDELNRLAAAAVDRAEFPRIGDPWRYRTGGNQRAKLDQIYAGVCDG